MTPADFRAARQRLGLSQEQLAFMLGYRARYTVSDIERGNKAPNGAAVRLLQAYLEGYRPADWPKSPPPT